MSEDERYCDHCERDTPHKCEDSTHERDSSNDWRECLVCGWAYCGLTGEYTPPDSTCPNCGSPNEPGVHCRRCGKEMPVTYSLEGQTLLGYPVVIGDDQDLLASGEVSLCVGQWPAGAADEAFFKLLAIGMTHPLQEGTIPLRATEGDAR